MPEVHGGEDTALILEAPGAEEVRRGRPLVHRSWDQFKPYLEENGLQRNQVVIDNALLCWPPLNDLRRFCQQEVANKNKRIMRQWRASKNEGLPGNLIPDPLDCCRPHILNQASRTPNLLLLGANSLRSATGKRKALRGIRGAFLEGYAVGTESHTQIIMTPENQEGWTPPPHSLHLRMMPSYHPAFILRDMEWECAFQQDIGKFFRWTRGELRWKEARTRITAPTPAQLEDFLFGSGRTAWKVVDVETNIPDRGEHPKLRTIQIGTEEEAYVIPIRSIDGKRLFHPHYYTRDDAQAILLLLRRFFQDPSILKVGHNFGYFDYPIICRELKISHIAPYEDTILFFRAAHTGLNRTLYTMGTLYTDVSDWKTSVSDRKIAVNPRSDNELCHYGQTDVLVNARCYPLVRAQAAERGQEAIVKLDHETQAACREMTTLGFHVWQEKRADLERSISQTIMTRKDRIRELVGNPKFNPRSTDQVGEYLYEQLGLPIVAYTDTGAPGTDENALRIIRTQGFVEGKNLECVNLIYLNRADEKRVNTYLGPARLCTDLRLVKMVKRHGVMTPIYSKGRTWADGRLRPHYNCACYDDETEILTETGWQFFKNLQGERVAQWWEDGSIDFTLPTYREYDHEGPMVHFQSDSSDLLLTPNHRMPIKSLATGKVKEFLAEDMPSNKITGWLTLHAGSYAGGSGVEISDGDLRVLAMLQADGSIHHDGSHGVTFAFRKARKIERCRELLIVANMPFSEYPPHDAKPEHAFYVSRDSFPQKILELLGKRKVFGPWVLDLTRHQVDIILDEIWYWDADTGHRNRYSSTKKENTDWLQALLVLSGIRANQQTAYPDGIEKGPDGSIRHRSPLHVLGVKRSPVNRITQFSTKTIEDYKGKVYCVTVPSSWVIVRRNGKVTVSGNTPETGRISSSEPNGQNWNGADKVILIPAPGHIYVGADYDQIELRLITVAAGLQKYWDVFKLNGDPHAITALLVYGKDFEDAMMYVMSPQQRAQYEKDRVPKKVKGKITDYHIPGVPDEDNLAMKLWKKMAARYSSLRTFAKSFVYLVVYGGSARTAWENLIAAEDEKGNLLFPDLSYEDVKTAYDAWMRGVPELPAYWKKLENFAKEHGYIAEPIMGRIRDFKTYDRNGVLNHPIQGGAAIIMAQALMRLRARLPLYKYGPGTGIVNQCHDALLTEIPDDPQIIADTEKDVKEAMTYEWNGMDFTVACHPGRNWKEAA